MKPQYIFPIILITLDIGAAVLKRLIEIFTDEGDVVIDPCAGSGSTLRAARECGRNSYGFEVSRKFYREAMEKMLGGV